MTTFSKLLLHLHFLLLLFFYFVSSLRSLTIEYPLDGLVPCLPRQIQALTEFKNEFDSQNCNNEDYFNGVWCDNTTGAVIKLQLPSGCFTGILKPNSSLFRFHQLRYLNLSYNNFISSSLPFQLVNLNKLEVLALSSNGFIGQVPSSFSNLNKLFKLDLSHNKLTGGFPFVRNMSKLSFLKLSYNHFSGTLNPNSSLFELRHLRYLSLSYNNFSSSLPYEFGKLNNLEWLFLFSNSFFGQVPPTISNLTQLNALILGENKLIGSFPLIQNLTNLSRLNLADNQFTGNVPSALLTMPFLSYLNLDGNDLTGFFEVLNSSTLSRLEFLNLDHNLFEGKILEPISKLTTLTNLGISYLKINYPIDLKLFSSLKSLLYLDLSGNNISVESIRSDSILPLTLEVLLLEQCNINEFPHLLKTLQDLDYLSISGNRIKGKIPEWLWSLPRLTVVEIRYNLFNGFEGSTESLVNSSIEELIMDGNSFEGTLPNLPLSINSLLASHNKFTGDIPLSICNRSLLVVLLLSYNNFTGPIPQCLSNLTFLDLRRNNFEGSILDTFHVGASMHTLDVGYNQLTGKLPRSLLNCSSLEFLGADNNKIKDTFPFWLKALPNLQVLIISSNKLYGPVSLPHQGPLGFPELRILEIANNKFIGSLPPNYFVNWKASTLSMNGDGGLYMIYDGETRGKLHYTYTNFIDLQYKGLSMEQQKFFIFYAAIDFSGNQLEGQIPESIGLLNALIALNLSNNVFSSHIPLSLANLKELESLDLSRNKLSGTIPQGLGSLSFLEYINVSYNQLKGEIPQGTQITGQPISCFEGNSGLCGYPLKESCFDAEAPPLQYHKQEEDKDEEEQVLNWKAAMMGYGVGVLFGVAIAQFIASYKPEWLAKIVELKKHRII